MAWGVGPLAGVILHLCPEMHENLMHAQFKCHEVSHPNPNPSLSINHLIVILGSPWGEELGGHFMTFTCWHFLPQVMVKFTRKARGNLVTITEISKHLTEYISGHDWSLINKFSLIYGDKLKSINLKKIIINNDFLKDEQAEILKLIAKVLASSWHHSKGKVKNNGKIWFIQSLQM